MLGRVCIEGVGNLRPDIEPAQLSPCKIGVISCSVLVIKGKIPRLAHLSPCKIGVTSEHSQCSEVWAHVWLGVGV